MKPDKKSHFNSGKRMRSGIFYFLIVITMLQAGPFVLEFNNATRGFPEMIRNEAVQRWIDSSKAAAAEKREAFKYNPNYLSEKQAYFIGLEPGAFRKLDSLLKSGRRFYDLESIKVNLGLSDAVSDVLGRRLRFSKGINKDQSSKIQVPSICINEATAAQLESVRGIGSVLSRRIIKFRDALGGFQHTNQLLDVYGVSTEVAIAVAARFPVKRAPHVVKINLNTASRITLSKFVYFKSADAHKIIAYRETYGSLKSISELAAVLGWPDDKIDRIALYLAL